VEAKGFGTRHVDAPSSGTWSPAWPGRAAPRDRQPWSAASLAEIARIYGLRNWAGQGYKQVKDELGWADFQVCSDTAIRRHQALVCCAFSFCWAVWFADSPPQDAAPQPGPGGGERGPHPAAPLWPRALRAVRAWLPLGPRCGAGGHPGPRRPSRGSCRPRSTRSRQAAACTSTSVI